MKELAISFIIALAALAACTPRGTTGPNSQQDTTTTSQDTVAVVQRVEEIYQSVFDVYQKATNLSFPNEGLDSLYCSSDWLNTLSAVIYHDLQLPDSMGYWEADYWIMGQDWQDLSVSDVHVVSMTSSTATVELKLHNCGNDKVVRLEMTREYEGWKIDNFIDVSANCDWKADMKQYLADNPLEE